MRSPFIQTVLATTIAMTLLGCGNRGVVEIGTVAPQSQYDDRMLDSLGSQRYTEQQMLYVRKVQEFERHIEELDDRRKLLESSLGMAQLEAGSGTVNASMDESRRMSDFASATHASQARIAQETARHATQQALIENERDRKLMQAELEANRRLSELGYAGESKDGGAQHRDAKAQQLKAEAQRQKALIESEALQEKNLLEQRFRVQIEDRKQLAAQAGAEAAEAQYRNNQALEQQRLTVALANADVERRVQTDIAKTQEALESQRKEMTSAISPFKAEIAQLQERLKFLEGQIETTRAEYEGRIAIDEVRLAKLQQEAERLGEVSRTLINNPVRPIAPPGGNSISAADGAAIQGLELALATEKNEMQARTAARLAAVERKLADDLSALSSRNGPNQANAVDANDSARQIDAIKAELALAKTEIINDARTRLAELSVNTEIAKANIVAPVVTGKAVYSGDYGPKPEAFAVNVPPQPPVLVATAPVPVTTQTIKPAPAAVARATKQEPVLVVSSFEPKLRQPVRHEVHDVVVRGGSVAGGAAKPLVINAAATTYTVVYRYSDKGSAEKFSAFLRAYGVNDFTYHFSAKLNEHVLHMGRYPTADQAATRVSSLNKLTATQHAKIVEHDL